MKLLQFRQILIFYVLNFLTLMSSIFRFIFVIVYIFLLSLLSCFHSFFFILFFFLSMTFHQTASILQYDHTLHIIISPMFIYIFLHRLTYLFFLCYSFQDALSSRKAFVRYISHEVRTPLNIGKNNPDHYISIFFTF